MTVQTSAGVAIYIGTTAALASGDTFTEIGEVTDIGEFGRVYNEIPHNSLKNRNVRKFKGSRNDGNIVLQLGRDLTDDGQADLAAALDSDDDYNFKIELNDAGTGSLAAPTTFLFKAKVMSFTTNIGGSEQVVGASVTLGIQSGTIAETPAV